MTDGTQSSSVSPETLKEINSWDHDTALANLQAALQLATEIELATIPIYLYAYYSICRKPGRDKPILSNKSDPKFPATAMSRFGDKAGAVVMSVAVEEMLHLSLASNILVSTGGMPVIYTKAPVMNVSEGGYPLPGLERLPAPCAPSERPLVIPLDKFSLEQLGHFMRIEYPSAKGTVVPAAEAAKLEWNTIGEAYDYIRAIVNNPNLTDADFQHAAPGQIATNEYAANNIDTVYPKAEFTFDNPPPVGQTGSASTVAVYTNNEDSHVTAADQKPSLWMHVASKADALAAIQTICNEGEGASYTAYADVPADHEESHYYKFWELSSQLEGYDFTGNAPQVDWLMPRPTVPSATTPVDGLTAPVANLGDALVYDFPKNPSIFTYNDEGAIAAVNLANALFQYMLILTETIFLVPADRQKLYFNRTMHQSMIWVMDKYYQALRTGADASGTMVVPTFDIDYLNPTATGMQRAETPVPLLGGTREKAHAHLVKLADECIELADKWTTPPESLIYYAKSIRELPDIGAFWSGNTPQTPSTLPDFLTVSTSSVTPPGNPLDVVTISNGPYKGAPKFPKSPPTNEQLDDSAGVGMWARHACMGLNSCKNQGRTLSNNCAGQGWCSTALAYNPVNPSAPTISDHTCHVLNNCRGQGGCGLYGTQDELENPGQNKCQTLGSCATPINAERFITDGAIRGQSVWLQARKKFAEKTWPGLDWKGSDPKPAAPPAPGLNTATPSENPFAHGPTIEWIEEASGQGMTACGSSGMSGAGSCA